MKDCDKINANQALLKLKAKVSRELRLSPLIVFISTVFNCNECCKFNGLFDISLFCSASSVVVGSVRCCSS